jgi:hypothetical protein
MYMRYATSLEYNAAVLTGQPQSTKTKLRYLLITFDHKTLFANQPLIHLEQGVRIPFPLG